MKRQVGLRLEEATAADAQARATRDGVSFNGYVTALIVTDLYGDEAASEEGGTVGEQQMADLQESFDDHERRLARLEELADREGA